MENKIKSLEKSVKLLLKDRSNRLNLEKKKEVQRRKQMLENERTEKNLIKKYSCKKCKGINPQGLLTSILRVRCGKFCEC